VGNGRRTPDLFQGLGPVTRCCCNAGLGYSPEIALGLDELACSVDAGTRTARQSVTVVVRGGLSGVALTCMLQ
jgi:hypothetical protein